MTQYRVDIDVFAGPLDLLLYLVRKEEVDIYDIPIAHITGQYLKYIEMLKLLDIDLAGDFLVMAATLMEIKSVMVLPRTELEDADDQGIQDPRLELIRQLLEYKKFKDAANLLEDSASRRKEKFTRPDSVISNLKPDTEPELDIDQVSIWTLLEAFDSIMQATGHLAKFDHIKDDTPIDLYQIEILHRLQTEGPMTFEEIFKESSSRLVMVGLLLALLELIHDQLIWVEQSKQLEPILVRALTDEPAEQAVQRTIVSGPVPEESETDPDRTPPIPVQELPAKDQPPILSPDDRSASESNNTSGN